jgi:hypothetical protein
MGMEDFQFLLGDLAAAFREDALWLVADWRVTEDSGQVRAADGYAGFAIRVTGNGQPLTVAGRFRIDPYEAALGGIEPGLGETQIWFYCDRATLPQPWPAIGDVLVIRGQTHEIVQRDEDDLGEFGFRLIRQEIGIATVTSEGVVSGPPVVNPLRPGPIVPARRRTVPSGQLMATAQPLPAGRPSRRTQIVEAYESAIAAGMILPTQPLKQRCAILHKQLGAGEGLSYRTLRRVVGEIGRDHGR